MNNGVDQIGFEQLGIGSVLRQNRLSVPANQREYSWTEEEVTTLLQDFARAINDDEPGYFLGTIVTIPRPDGTVEVVDGQQRLATTAILLATIRDYLKEREDIIAESIENDFLTVVDRDRRERVPRLRLNVDDNELCLLFIHPRDGDHGYTQPERAPGGRAVSGRTLQPLEPHSSMTGVDSTSLANIVERVSI